ncbi:MAG: hypothetical protein MJ252_21550 [archaeon]|nr:hypothetical protein [archaeon]
MVEEAKLAEYEKKLETNLFIGGANPGKEDAEVLAKCMESKFVPDQEKNPNFWAWYSNVVLYEDCVIKTWGQDAKPAKGGKGGKGKEDKKEEKKKEETADDDFDPFAEETPEEKEAAKKEKEEKKKKDGKKEKKKHVEKSCIIFDVKGFESDQDLPALYKKITTTIKKDGLVWNREFKLEEIAFGVKKLVMGCTIEDEKVSIDEIIDELLTWEEEVQSVDITSFNKI